MITTPSINYYYKPLIFSGGGVKTDKNIRPKAVASYS